MTSVAIVYILSTFGIDDGLAGQGEQGLCLPPPALWPLAPWVDVAGGVLITAGIYAIMALINKEFNVLRSNTRLQLGLFALIAAGVPRLVVNINSGIIVALVMNVCLMLLFSCYDNPRAVRRVFLAFLMMSVGSMMQYCFLFYIPVLWLVCAQMRIFRGRTVAASLMGLATPWIIILGFGIISPNDIHAPRVIGIFGSYVMESAIYLLVITAVSALMLIGAMVMNVSRTISYNARDRAFNGALSLISLVTIVAIAVNYNNLLAYLPLLNVCAAYQITHWFVNHRFEKQYIAVFAVCCCYAAFYVWRIVL